MFLAKGSLSKIPMKKGVSPFIEVPFGSNIFKFQKI